MKNPQLHARLRQLEYEGAPLTLSRLAVAIGSRHSHLSLVFNRSACSGQKFGGGRGGRTRRTVAHWLRRNFGTAAAAVLTELGWDAEGNLNSSPPVTMEK